MTLPKLHVKLTADGQGEVWLNDEKLPGVIAVQIAGVVGDLPRVAVTIRPGELTADLPETGVQLITNVQGSAADFMATVNPRALEAAVVDDGDLDTTFSEGAVGVLSRMAREFDERR